VATTVTMPKMGMTMQEGTITRWLKRQGDTVRQGEPLFEVQTDKVNMEVESPGSGVLLQVLAGAGETVPVNQPVAVIGEPGEVPGQAPGVEVPPAESGAPGRTRATPIARRLARESGLPLSAVTGSGPGGRVTRRDVEAAISAATDVRPAHPPERSGAPASLPKSTPLAGIRKVVAERMAYSARTAPHVTLTTEAVVTGLVSLREQLLPEMERRHGLRPSFTDFLVLLVSRVLRENPAVNATLADGVITILDQVNVGVAVAVENGLVVPVVKEADRLSLAGISRTVRDLAAAARSGALKPDDYSGGTFTVSNLGTYGIDAFTPIINPPESAILGVGRIVEKPVAESGQVVIRPTMWLSLSFDHRVLDGAPAARFLSRIRELVESPVGIFAL